MTDAPRLLTAIEVGELLRVDPSTVLKLPIPRHRIGQRAIRFNMADVMLYLASKREVPAVTKPRPKFTGRINLHASKPTDKTTAAAAWAKRINETIH